MNKWFKKSGTGKKSFSEINESLENIFTENKDKEDDESFEDLFIEESRNKKKINSFIKQKEDRSVKKHFISKKEIKKRFSRTESEVDLHGLTEKEAILITEKFIRSSIRSKFRTIRIITGKGLHSENAKPVIQPAVSQYLIRLKREKIIFDYEWEKKDIRKSGSVKIYLNSVIR